MKKILIVKLSAIGDVVHTLPVCASIRKKFPSAEISWIVEEMASDLLVGNPNIDKVIISPRRSVIAEFKRGHFLLAYRLTKDFLRQIRQMGTYDIAIDIHGLLKSALIMFFIKAKRKIGYNSMQEFSGLFYNEKIFEDMSKHAVDRYLDFATYLGVGSIMPDFFIPASAETKATAKNILERNGIKDGEQFVVISPTALWETKLWQNEQFALLADMIITKLGMKVVLTGSYSHECVEIENMSVKNKIINLAGQTTLLELAEICRQAKVVVSTDSGAMHIASAVGVPIIAIFGPTDPKLTGPYGKNSVVIKSSVACSPCLKKKCSDKKCMKEISAERVFFAIRDEIL
ncbi:MAG: lipopolysaccharide heptosyltransferase II [Deltaproteobacteria bacterium]